MSFDAEAYLGSLEPFGWRFGLERIQRLVTLLGVPQHRFASVHVVGTNGKSSVATMTAALLDAHGAAAGAYLSPHTSRWSERVLVRGAEIASEDFAAAVERVAESVETVNRSLDEGDVVTQFEAATAAAFVALARAGVQFGVIEAGLGGRLDATNVLPSKVTALTSVGMEHTEWLGETLEQIAGEKLAVVRDHTTLVVGELPPGAEALAERTAAERGASLVRAPRPDPELTLVVPGAYARRNFAVATEAATAAMGGLDPRIVREVAASTALPGRMEVVAGEPPLVLDAAHNPDGARALAEALGEVAGRRPVVACLAVLADKDAPGIVAALAPRVEALVCTEVPAAALAGAGRPGAVFLGAEPLAEMAREAGVATVEAIADPGKAAERAIELAGRRHGVALASGSHYLLPFATNAR